MARSKELDPDKALNIAVNVFWRLGYEHTSLETLMREMGISILATSNPLIDHRRKAPHSQRTDSAPANQGF
jgi:hypothetical protein